MPAISDAFGQGTHASRPAAAPANKGYYYLETDTNGGTLFQSDGATWVQLAAAIDQSFSVQVMADADLTIAKGNTLVLSTGNGHTATLPAAADAKGQFVAVVNQHGGHSSLATTGSETFQDQSSTTLSVGDNSGTTNNCGATLGMSDGTGWNILAHMNSL